MKRTVFAIVALISAVIICFAGFNIISNTCNEIKDSLKDVSAYAREENISMAQKKTQQSVELWEDIHGKIEAFTPHSETDELEEIIKSLPVFAQQGNMERLEQESEKAIHRLEHIIKNEKPLLSNIF